MDILTTKYEDGLMVITAVKYHPPLKQTLLGMLVAGLIIACWSIGILALIK